METVKRTARYRGGRTNLAPMKKKYGSVTPAIKIQSRAMFESGMYNSTAELHAECEKLFKNCPAAATFRNWANEEGWDKFKMKKVMEEVRATNYKELFAAEGFGDPETVKEIVGGIRLADTTLQAISGKITKAMKESKDFVPSLEVLECLKGLTKELFTNYKIKGDFLEQRHKLVEAGSYGRQNIKVTTPQSDLLLKSPEERKKYLEEVACDFAIQHQ
jgi:hypothetical protein